MHEVAVAEPGVGFWGRVPDLLSFGFVPAGQHPGAEMLDEVFDDCARFGEDEGFLLGIVGAFNGQDRDLAEGVDVFEGGGGEPVDAGVRFDGVG